MNVDVVELRRLDDTVPSNPSNPTTTKKEDQP